MCGLPERAFGKATPTISQLPKSLPTIPDNNFSPNDLAIVQLLDRSWYLNEDVVSLAKALLGKVIYSVVDGQQTAAIISETEAYRGPEDRASHAWNNRRTSRTAPMFEAGGIAYVYLCYGIHHLFNIVTGPPEVPHAVLVRAGIPLWGMDTMLTRRNCQSQKQNLLSGPGTLSQALGILTSHTGMALYEMESLIRIYDTDWEIKENDILHGPRVGIDYAGEDKHLPWRFRLSSGWGQK